MVCKKYLITKKVNGVNKIKIKNECAHEKNRKINFLVRRKKGPRALRKYLIAQKVNGLNKIKSFFRAHEKK
jgi:hypothetical protein